MEDILWQAIRREIVQNLQSREYDISEMQIDTLTDLAMNDESLWQNFTDELMDLIDGELE